MTPSHIVQIILIVCVTILGLTALFQFGQIALPIVGSVVTGFFALLNTGGFQKKDNDGRVS